jgi:hypothetical protein
MEAPTFEQYEQAGGKRLDEAAFAAALPRALDVVRARLALFDVDALDGADAEAYRRAVFAAAEHVDDPSLGASSWSAGDASVTVGDSADGIDGAVERALSGAPCMGTWA